MFWTRVSSRRTLKVIAEMITGHCHLRKQLHTLGTRTRLQKVRYERGKNTPHSVRKPCDSIYQGQIVRETTHPTWRSASEQNCRKCGIEEEETTYLIVCECPATNYIRVRLYGKPLLLPEDVMAELPWKIARVCIGDWAAKLDGTIGQA